jgi:uncharacterized membrane protein YedE/YeeE
VTETPPARKPLPVIPLFVFAAIDLLLALALLLVGGFTISFLVVGLIGVVLALLGWIGLRGAPEPE